MTGETTREPFAESWRTPALEATDLNFRADPHAILDRLRDEDPVHQDTQFDRVVLTRAADVAAVLADRTLSVDPYKARSGAFATLGLVEERRGRDSLVFLDDPDHGRLRRLITKAFSARAIDALRPRVEEIAATLIDDFDVTGPVDLVARLAMPLPVLVIASMLGLDDDQMDDFKRWSDESLLFFKPERSSEEQMTLHNAVTSLNECLERTIRSRRSVAREDLISGLVAAQTGEDRLSDEEIIDTCRALLVAGNITTTDLIGNAISALLLHPEQLAKVVADPALRIAAVEETLRYDPPVTSWNRQALEERSISGCPVQSGQTITSFLVAANHDPDLHAEPHRFDITREVKTHFSFGGGGHFCLGASLARMEADVALGTLLQRFPSLRLACGSSMRRKALPGFSGYEAIWAMMVRDDADEQVDLPI